MRSSVVVLAVSLSTGLVQPSPVQALTPRALHARLADKSFTLINVHVPYAGEIPGTDALIPYNRILIDPRVPTNRAAALVLYCRSGRMSALALDSLRRAGYTNVRELTGGMDAWQTAGYPLIGGRR